MLGTYWGTSTVGTTKKPKKIQNPLPTQKKTKLAPWVMLAHLIACKEFL
jgi:hypothetical protein